MCTRCNGFLVRDRFMEHVTKTAPAYYCVNCGDYVDPVVIKNRYTPNYDVPRDTDCTPMSPIRVGYGKRW